MTRSRRSACRAGRSRCRWCRRASASRCRCRRPASPGCTRWGTAARARSINGEGYRSLAMDQRLYILDLERSALDGRKALLLEERREAFSNFSEEGPAAKKREEYQKRQAQYDKDEADYNARVALFLR